VWSSQWHFFFFCLGLTQTTDFYPCRFFFALQGEKESKMKKSTLLPQAGIAFA
jgi:hypothetical protein